MSQAFRGRRVLVTGHTGFKGGWLSLWLVSRGARVAGVSLPPDTDPSFFELVALEKRLESSHLADIRDRERLRTIVHAARPEIIFHLAAQSLVRRAYREPVETIATNVLGTAHLLDAVRDLPSVRAVVVVTTDKCYENREWDWPYREDDPLGGHDPYSASKAACEIVTASYRRAFFSGPGQVAIATARAGNVIGGGDWAEDRLVPDAIRAFARGEPLLLRNPMHIRPWQHVLEPLAGYLGLAEALLLRPEVGVGAWNFGPEGDGVGTATVARLLADAWGSGASVKVVQDPGPHEAAALRLDASRAKARLGWCPRLSLVEAIGWTVDWYREVGASPSSGYDVTMAQIRRYEEGLAER